MRPAGAGPLDQPVMQHCCRSEKMDDKTLQALTTLAAKLGTTAEYLWGVLLKQAPISGVVGLLADAALLYAVYFAWTRLLKVEFTGYDSDIKKGGAYLGLFIGSALCLVAALGNLPIEVAALLNPEYWALRQILK
jgi:hypothetical protein